jgi:hypothetical protein
MAKRSKVDHLPQELKDWLQRALVKNNFSGYAELAEEVRKHGIELGVVADVSKSGLHRYGSKLERRLSAIKASTEAARLIADAAPDDEDARSSAIISLVQTELFEAIVSLQEAESADAGARVELLSKAAKNIATLARASVGQKKWLVEIRDKVKQAADAAEKIGRRGGLSKDGIDELRREILGISQ